MRQENRQEAFIPLRRSDLLELCLQHGRLDGAAAEQFRQLCQLLTAYHHYRSQVTLELLKDAFAPFNRASDTQPLRECSAEQPAQAEEPLVRPGAGAAPGHLHPAEPRRAAGGPAGALAASLGLIIGTLLLVLPGPESASMLLPQVQGSARLYTVLLASLSAGMTLGGFAVRQHNGYKNKRLKFLKQVAEPHFFKHLVTNQGVLHTLVDAAAEEECEKVILVAYHLLSPRQPLTSAQLDAAIEHWTHERLGERAHFDVAKTLQQMGQLSAPAGWRAFRSASRGPGSCCTLTPRDAAICCHLTRRWCCWTICGTTRLTTPTALSPSWPPHATLLALPAHPRSPLLSAHADAQHQQGSTSRQATTACCCFSS